MFTIPIIIALVFFVILLVADIIHPMVNAALLFFSYMFVFVAFDLTLAQKIFYPIGILFWMAARANLEGKLQTNANSHDFNGSKPQGFYSGIQYHAVSIIVGIGMLGMMFVISAIKGVGLKVVPLAVSSDGGLSLMTELCGPALSMSIGFIENRMFISLLVMLMLSKDHLAAFPEVLAGMVSVIPILGQFLGLFIMLLVPLVIVMPIALTALAFGVFHLVAYAMVWKLVLWAALIMLMWIVSYYLTGRDTTAMDTAHGSWNTIVTAQQALSIAL